MDVPKIEVVDEPQEGAGSAAAVAPSLLSQMVPLPITEDDGCVFAKVCSTCAWRRRRVCAKAMNTPAARLPMRRGRSLHLHAPLATDAFTQASWRGPVGWSAFSWLIAADVCVWKFDIPQSLLASKKSSMISVEWTETTLRVFIKGGETLFDGPLRHPIRQARWQLARWTSMLTQHARHCRVPAAGASKWDSW